MRVKAKFLFVMMAIMALTTVHARASVWPDACGSDSVQYKAKTGRKGQPLSTPEAGKGQVVIVQTLVGDMGAGPTTRIAVDGSWVGADKGASYFVLSLTPGTHKVCVSRQGSSHEEKENLGVVTVSVQEGKTVFYEFTITRNDIDPASTHAAGQALGYATPDMTAKPSATLDTASFQAVNADKGMSLVSARPPSMASAK